jgi:hypothetical protein
VLVRLSTSLLALVLLPWALLELVKFLLSEVVEAVHLGQAAVVLVGMFIILLNCYLLEL